MDPATYLIIHLAGLGALAIGLGGMFAGGPNRRLFTIVHGIALTLILVSGFGLLAKLHLGFPHFAIVKVILWLLLGFLPLILRKAKIPLLAGVSIAITLIAILAWLGVAKPLLW
jgi:hypothetical protein